MVGLVTLALSTTGLAVGFALTFVELISARSDAEAFEAQLWDAEAQVWDLEQELRGITDYVDALEGEVAECKSTIDEGSLLLSMRDFDSAFWELAGSDCSY